MQKVYLGMLLIGLISGCSSPKPKLGVENAGHEAVVATLNNESKPSWVEDAAERTFYEDSGHVVSVGSATLESSSRIDAGMKICEANSRANLGRIVSNRMESITHIADEGVDFSAIQLRSITAEATKLMSVSGIKPSRRWYEKVMITGDDGVPRGEYRFHCETRMTNEDFKKTLVQAARKSDTKAGLSESFSQHVEKHFDQFLNEGKAEEKVKPEDARKPASSQEESKEIENE